MSKRVFWFKRFLLLLLTVFLIVLGIVIIQLGDRPQITQSRLPATFTVMTYNIHHGVGTDQVYSLARIADVIRSVSPDLVCLNEVDYQTERTFGDDQAAQLAELLGMDFSFARNLALEGGWYGNAILSRHKFHFSENKLYHYEKSSEQRGLLHVMLSAREKQLHLYTTHLGTDSVESAAQTAEMLNIMLKWGLNEPVILAGDLNMEPHYQRLQELYYYFRGSMNGENENFTYSTKQPSRKIDYILANAELELRSAAVLVNETTRVASDHFPVVAQYRIRGAP